MLCSNEEGRLCINQVTQSYIPKVKMASKGYKQEMPPPAGYGPIEWAKQIPKKKMSGITQFGLFIGFTGLSWVGFYYQKRRHCKDDLEMRDARLAVLPLLLAERNRLLLKQIRENRDEENELMKNVDGWVTGTLWGKPVYHNIRDRWIDPSADEYFAHCKYWERMYTVHDKLNH